MSGNIYLFTYLFHKTWRLRFSFNPKTLRIQGTNDAESLKGKEGTDVNSGQERGMSPQGQKETILPSYQMLSTDSMQSS